MNQNNRGSSNGNRSNGTYYSGRAGMQRGNSGYMRTGNTGCSRNTSGTSMYNNPVCDSNCANAVSENDTGCMDAEAVVVVVRDNDCEATVSSECRPSMNDPIACMPLAMAYVPWQDYEAIYSEAEAWQRGTIFRKLDLEFMARRCN